MSARALLPACLCDCQYASLATSSQRSVALHHTGAFRFIAFHSHQACAVLLGSGSVRQSRVCGDIMSPRRMCASLPGEYIPASDRTPKRFAMRSQMYMCGHFCRNCAISALAARAPLTRLFALPPHSRCGSKRTCLAYPLTAQSCLARVVPCSMAVASVVLASGPSLA